MTRVYPMLDLRIAANSGYRGCGRRRHVWQRRELPWPFAFICVRCGKLKNEDIS